MTTKRTALSTLLVGFLFACGGNAPPPAAPPPAAPPPAPVASTPPPASTTPPPAPEPSAEDKKKAEDAAKLADARAKWDEKNKAELARWTPEMHTAAKTLADKPYPSGKAGIEAAMKGPQRVPGDADRDKYRHPAETMAFFGLKPTMSVLDIGPGDGWYTELLAPVLAKKGKYFATSQDPNGPADSPATFGGQRWAAFLAKAPEIYGGVQTLVVDGKAPKLGSSDGSLDMVLAMREMHGWVNDGTAEAWLAEIHRVLKNGGVFGVVDHRAAPTADPKESAKNGYLPEKWVISTVEAAGFKLAGKSEINANPKDTKDYPDGVWDLPPSFRKKDVDHDKYAAIGESDRMTLKFVKAAPAAAAKTATAATPAAKPAAAKTP
jgi:predicted methyltransferase